MASYPLMLISCFPIYNTSTITPTMQSVFKCTHTCIKMEIHVKRPVDHFDWSNGGINSAQVYPEFWPGLKLGLLDLVFTLIPNNKGRWLTHSKYIPVLKLMHSGSLYNYFISLLGFWNWGLVGLLNSPYFHVSFFYTCPLPLCSAIWPPCFVLDCHVRLNPQPSPLPLLFYWPSQDLTPLFSDA